MSQFCRSVKLIPDPEFSPSRTRTPDLRSQIQQQKRWGKKKYSRLTFVCGHKCNKTENLYYFLFWTGTEKVLRLRILAFLPKKNLLSSLNSLGWIRDQESEKTGDPGVKKAPDPGSATLLCMFVINDEFDNFYAIQILFMLYRLL